MKPPVTRISPVTDTLHGTSITDNYRWLEGDNSDPNRMGQVTPDVSAWTDAQSGETHLRHRITPDGFYRGKRVIEPRPGAGGTIAAQAGNIGAIARYGVPARHVEAGDSTDLINPLTHKPVCWVGAAQLMPRFLRVAVLKTMTAGPMSWASSPPCF